MTTKEILNLMLDLRQNPAFQSTEIVEAANKIAKHAFECIVYADKGLLTTQEIKALEDGRKLEAVKLYKNRTGVFLMAAKNDIEAYMMSRWGKKHFDR